MDKIPTHLILSQSDRASSCWNTIKRFLDDRLDLLRQRNDHAMPEADRNALIGEIRAVKVLRSLGDDVPAL